ncbi:unnamed protein product [Adineta ricciae]|uniref:Uncharacterized protein n=1 Tax=Adineta ricciae TaxID=249248 RepID=A0A815IQ39_ADIRI|nr:unnamed protein product [Adineta ricciae]CAF1368550.1 unnamed protein product [Adineta ricciae]
MQRHEQIIELSDHVKNKLKQHHSPAVSSPFITSCDEFVEVDSTDDGNDSLLVTSDPVNRARSETFTTYRVDQPSAAFFTYEKSKPPSHISVLHEKYAKQHVCEACVHRDHIIHYERQRLLRLYEENKQLHEQLNSSRLLNQQYENDIEKLKIHLRKVNSHLYEYHVTYDQLKQKIVEEKKQDEHEDKQESTMEHLKRLRHEVNMYNRLVAAKQQHEQRRI